MKILLTGANGQLGMSLRGSVPNGYHVVAMDQAELDITDAAAVTAMVSAAKPDLIINAAAYTNVDKAETEREAAYAVNAAGPANLAAGARDQGARLIHISTDFVFDGRQSRPYKPSDTPNPLNVYGHSKLAGERSLIESGLERYLIIRTAWVYAANGRNFLRTMLRLMGERAELNVVADQVGSPTWATSLAQAVWKAAASGTSGIYHWTDGGVASWYDFAVAIQEEAAQAGLLSASTVVHPIGTEQFPTPARRPAFSVLDKAQTYQDLGMDAVHWRHSLRAAIREIANA